MPAPTGISTPSIPLALGRDLASPLLAGRAQSLQEHVCVGDGQSITVGQASRQTIEFWRVELNHLTSTQPREVAVRGPAHCLNVDVVLTETLSVRQSDLLAHSQGAVRRADASIPGHRPDLHRLRAQVLPTLFQDLQDKVSAHISEPRPALCHAVHYRPDTSFSFAKDAIR